jgi:hypothetical protein
VRIFRTLMSPKGGLGLTLLAFALAFVAHMLDQADYRSPALVYVFAVLAGVSALEALAAFFGSWVAGHLSRIVSRIGRYGGHSNGLKRLGWWSPAGLKRLENPEIRDDIRSLSGYVRVFGHQFRGFRS